MGKPYTIEFYTRQRDASLKSAREVIPLVLEILPANSVVDVGCGIGTWASVFYENGVRNVVGLDGPHVDQEQLLIPHRNFVSVDLEKPFRLGRRFDLVVCLEVIEHVPESCAETLIESLVSLGPVILFSGAIPHQGGTHHVNEQWQLYWAKRFLRHQYVAVDCIRRRIWGNPSVAPWYAQNILLFVEEDHLRGVPLLKAEFENTDLSQLSMVHPAVYMQWADPERRDPKYAPMSKVLAALPFALRRALRDTLRGKSVKREARARG